MVNILAVIPARGNSKRIPRKNCRLIYGRPLITYAINNALAVSADTVVSTDDDEIASIAGEAGATVLPRPEQLSGDAVTLDPVIFDAVVKAEALFNKKYDVVITLQPTSPTLKAETLKKALGYFFDSLADTLLSVKNEPVLSWKKSDCGGIVPEYEKRLNSQQLPAKYIETGAFVITKREFVTENSRFGADVRVFEVPANEAIDIDYPNDWILAESILGRKKILLRADGSNTLGMGHIYRCLTLAEKLIGHEILFVTNPAFEEGYRRIRELYQPCKTVTDDAEYIRAAAEFAPDIIVNDILNTSKDLMTGLRKHARRIVNFEDVGEGAKYADAVINALYDGVSANNIIGNIYSGSRYFLMRDEFFEEKPKEFSEKVENIMIIFGGSDPSNLTRRLYNICRRIHPLYPEIKFSFITGFGYIDKENLNDDAEHNIYVYHDSKRVSKHMSSADIAVTSQGRTIFELACMGVPAIVLAHNQREIQHTFASFQNGFVNLGLHSNVDDASIMKTLEWLIATPNIRHEMRNLMLTKEFTKGQHRVLDLILNN